MGARRRRTGDQASFFLPTRVAKAWFGRFLGAFAKVVADARVGPVLDGSATRRAGLRGPGHRA
jgi:hypothetical protein